MDLVLSNSKEMIEKVKFGDSLGCSQPCPGIVILRNMGLAKSRVRTLNFKKVEFCLIKELIREIPWAAVLRDKENEQRW